MDLTNLNKMAKMSAISIVLVFAGCLSEEDSLSVAINDDGEAADNPPVAGTNSPPSISGTPADAVLVGDTYSFTPTANDPDGDALSFTVENLPSWASFSASSGAVTGTPQMGDIGSFSDIRISVSDGKDTAGMPAFSVTVAQSANASISISWTAPTQNTDGSPLVDLAGYNFYYGTSLGSYPNMVPLNTAGATSFVIDNLLPGTYYVIARSVNMSGVESVDSGYVVKTAQ